LGGPKLSVFGGCLGNLLTEWFSYFRQQMPSWSINHRSSEIPLISAKYGVSAAIAGAAALCYCEPAANCDH
jgi:hypothetical protein